MMDGRQPLPIIPNYTDKNVGQTQPHNTTVYKSETAPSTYRLRFHRPWSSPVIMEVLGTWTLECSITTLSENHKNHTPLNLCLGGGASNSNSSRSASVWLTHPPTTGHIPAQCLTVHVSSPPWVMPKLSPSQPDPRHQIVAVILHHINHTASSPT